MIIRKTGMLVCNLTERLQNIRERQKYVFRVTETGEQGYLVDDVLISEQEFSKRFPTDFTKITNPKGSSSCKKHNWVDGNKSY